MTQIYVAESEGYKPEILQDNTTKGSRGFEISIGATNRPHGTAKYHSDGSYSIKSYDNGISITGVGKLGVMHGAMGFLQKCGGYYYMSWNDLLVSRQEHFVYDTTKGISIDYERSFLYTDTDLCYPCLNPASDQTDPNRNMVGKAGYEPPRTGRLYALAFGLNGFYSNTYALPKSEAGWESTYLSSMEGYYTSPSQIVGTACGHVHTLLAEYVPATTYFDAHPEWYCADVFIEMLGASGYVEDSSKHRDSTQLCFYRAVNDPELYNLILQHCYDILESKYDPSAKMQILSITENDGSKICMCDLCVKHRMSYGDTSKVKESYEILELCNKLSKDIHKNGKYSNVYIDTLAYIWSLRAPTGLTADDHVIIRFAPIDRCYGHYFDCSASEDSRNAEYFAELKKWMKIAKHVWIWEYNINFRVTIGPFANVNVLQHDIKLYHSLGIEGIFLQSNDRHFQTNAEFGDIRNYIAGRMLQDPSLDYEEELKFFTDAYYGAAGVYVREYMKRMERQMAFHQTKYEYRDHSATIFSLLSDIYADEAEWSDGKQRMPASEIAACEKLWTQIDALQTLTAEQKNRLQKLKISWRLVKSTLKVYEFGNESSYKTENEKLISDMKALGITGYAIIGDWKLSQCKHTQLQPDDWVTGN